MQIEVTPDDVAQGVALAELLLSDQSLAPAMGCPPDVQEALYHRAHMLYEQAKYEEAKRVFTFLMLANHADRRYYLAFAACLQMQRDYKDAIKYYGVASVLMLTDPQPAMHMAECHLALGNFDQARSSIDYAITQARAHEEHRGLFARLEAMQAFMDARKENTHD